MSYKEQLNEAKKAKRLQSLNPTFLTWKEKGQEVVGRYLDRIEVASGVGQGSYYQYLFDTDDGRVKFALGQATDKEVGGLMVRGHVYQISFSGKETIGKGRTINRFQIVEVLAPESSSEEEEPIPF